MESDTDLHRRVGCCLSFPKIEFEAIATFIGGGFWHEPLEDRPTPFFI